MIFLLTTAQAFFVVDARGYVLTLYIIMQYIVMKTN